MAAKRIAKRGKMDFIDFILEAENDKKLTIEFLGCADVNALETFFKDNGYDISAADCERILQCIQDADGVSIGVKEIAAAVNPGERCY